MTLAEWLLFVSALLGLAVLVSIGARRLRLPLTVVLAVVGFVTAWIGGRVELSSPLHGHVFEEVLVFVFLPILVFEAALGLSTRAFFRNLLAITVLAVPALIVSTVVVGLAVYVGLGTSLAVALVFGALISATDPVAVVAVFRELGVPQRLLAIVEGESLLNDGVAIVLFHILLTVAVGGSISVTEGVIDFVLVFFGGIVIGVLVGFLAAFLLPWIDRLSAAALSLAVAYGGFVLADEVFGFSGVTATLAAGLVLGGLAPSRASAEIRAGWHALWEVLGYVANALLFLLIGLAIDPGLLVEHGGAIVLAVVAVLVARTVAVVPLVAALERIARIPAVGLRNQAVLIWGGLRGGVTLALALALPEDLADRELLIAMTGGVVLTTLLINATTMSVLVGRLHLAEPSRADRFLALTARLSGVQAARAHLEELGIDDAQTISELDQIDRDTRQEADGIDLHPEEELLVVTRRALAVERETYQRLHDAGLLQPVVTRTLLHEVDDQIEEVGLGHESHALTRERSRATFDRVMKRLTTHLPPLIGDAPDELAYAEASARQIAARRVADTLGLFAQLPNITPERVDQVQQLVERWEQQAIAELAELDARLGEHLHRLRQVEAQAISRMAVEEALRDLAAVGLLPDVLVTQITEEVAAEIGAPERSGATV